MFKIFGDNKAVTPVIGVMLMIVVTVILAAAVSSFASSVDTQEAAPQATFKVTAKYSDGAIFVDHLGGDTLMSGKMKVQVSKDNMAGSFNMSRASYSPDPMYFRPGDVATLDYDWYYDDDGDWMTPAVVTEDFSLAESGAIKSDDGTSITLTPGALLGVSIIDADSGQTVYSTTVSVEP